MKATTQLEHALKLQRAVEHIDLHLGPELGVEQLARLSGMSEFHFRRIFRHGVGESPARYLRRLRLERAARHLIASHLSVRVVGQQAGYETIEAFNRSFSASFGLPPARFRQTRSPRRATTELPVEIQSLAPRRIACIRHVGPYAEAHRVLTTLAGWMTHQGVPARGPAIYIYWDDQRSTPARKLRCDVALTLPPEFPVERELWIEAGIRLRKLAGGDYAVVHYNGPYPYDVARIQRAYDAVYMGWLPRLGRLAADAPTFECAPQRRDLEGPHRVALHIPLLPTQTRTHAAR